MSIKPKQWLFDNGHIQVIGRGRLSAAHISLIKEAVSNGVDIEGYSISTPKPDATAAPTVQRVKIDTNKVMDVPDMSRDENFLMAYRFEDGKRVEVGMRTVDNNCGSSLSYCRCESPRVWVDHERQAVVNFAPRAK